MGRQQQYRKLAHSTRIDLIYQNKVHGLALRRIARESGIQYNTIRNIVQAFESTGRTNKKKIMVRDRTEGPAASTTQPTKVAGPFNVQRGVRKTGLFDASDSQIENMKEKQLKNEVPTEMHASSRIMASSFQQMIGESNFQLRVPFMRGGLLGTEEEQQEKEGEGEEDPEDPEEIEDEGHKDSLANRADLENQGDQAEQKSEIPTGQRHQGGPNIKEAKVPTLKYSTDQGSKHPDSQVLTLAYESRRKQLEGNEYFQLTDVNDPGEYIPHEVLEYESGANLLDTFCLSLSYLETCIEKKDTILQSFPFQERPQFAQFMKSLPLPDALQPLEWTRRQVEQPLMSQPLALDSIDNPNKNDLKKS